MRLSFAPLATAVALMLAGTAHAAPPPPASPPPAPAAPAPAPGPTPAKPPKSPKLIVAISVDQFATDVFDRYRRFYTRGLARLQEGAVFPAGYQSHAATETCPGHSTLLTGARPARTGIIANNWFDSTTGKRIYCAEDERDAASTAKDPVVSPWHLRVPTLGDRMKAANPASRNVAVSAKDRAVIMMGGHSLDTAIWWKDGAFTNLAGKPLPASVVALNRDIAAKVAVDGPGLAVPAWCANRDHAVPVGDFTLGTGHFPIQAGKADSFRVSPRIDAATATIATQLVDAMKLGQRAAPDILSVSFSATDYVGHAYGNGGVEMCIQMDELDRSIGVLLDHLDALKIDYVVVLSADHGGLDAPERLDEQAYPAATRVTKSMTPGELNKAVTARTGISVPTGALVYGDGAFGDFYVTKKIDAAQRTTVLAALVDQLKADPQVAAVFTAQELAAAPMPPAGMPQDWTLAQRARASFDPERSGDVIALLKRGIVPIDDPRPGYTATHGSAWDYDRRVPMLFWRRGLAGFEQPAPVETVDIAPTLAAVLGLAVPAGQFDGRCLDIDGGTADSCHPPR
jgi:predicted AlkP superfamily pyrophosphatase or phosphodiesterase